MAKTDGVPLYVEELAKMLFESELLRGEDDQYTLTGPLTTMGGCDRSPSGASCCHWEFDSLRHINWFDAFSIRI